MANSKRIAQDDVARQWSRNNQGKPPNEQVASFKKALELKPDFAEDAILAQIQKGSTGLYAFEAFVNARGRRGAGRWQIPVNSLPTNTAQAQAAWDSSWADRPGSPVVGDQANFFEGTLSNFTGTAAWSYDGAIWINQAEIIDGDLVVTGSITTDKIENGTIQGNDLNLSSVKAALGDLLYPIGSIYCNYSNSTDPGSLLGFGSWTRIEGKVVVGYHAGDSDFGSLGEDPSYGEKKHQLTVAELASHTHVIGVSEISDRDDDENKHTAVMRGTSNTEATGGDVPHNNLQPYAVVNMWRRTA